MIPPGRELLRVWLMAQAGSRNRLSGGFFVSNGRSRPPAFQLYAADWLSDGHVRAMTPAQRGVYIDLLCYQWREGSLPDDIGVLARLVGVDAAEFDLYWSGLEPRFPRVQTENGPVRQNARMERDRGTRETYTKAQQRKGILSGIARRTKHLTAEPVLGAGSHPARTQSNSASATASATAAAAAVPLDLNRTRLSPSAQQALEILEGNLHAEALQVALGLVRASQNPDALLLTLRAFGPGGIDEVAGVGWADVGKALRELCASPGTFSPARLRAFIRGVKQGPPPGLRTRRDLGYPVSRDDYFAACRSQGLPVPDRAPDGFASREAMERAVATYAASLQRTQAGPA